MTTLQTAFNDYSFLIARGEILTFAEWADRIESVFNKHDVVHVTAALRERNEKIEKTNLGTLTIREW